MAAQIFATQGSYHPVAEEYARNSFDELQHKPFDLKMLDRPAQEVNVSVPLCDLGCKPGSWS